MRGLESENDERGTLTAKSLARMTGALDDAGAADEALALVGRHVALLAGSDPEETEEAVMLWRRVAMAREEEGRFPEALDAYRGAFSRAGFLRNERGETISFTRAMRLPDGASAQPVEGAPALGPDGWLAAARPSGTPPKSCALPSASTSTSTRGRAAIRISRPSPG